jgi:hypothetical protein
MEFVEKLWPLPGSMRGAARLSMAAARPAHEFAFLSERL